MTNINRIDEWHECKLQSIYVCHVRLKSTLVTRKINNNKTTKTIKQPRRDLMHGYWGQIEQTMPHLE